MSRRLLILTIIVTLPFLAGRAQDNLQDLKLRDEIRKFGQAEVIIAYPGRQAIDEITRNVSIRSVRDDRVYITLSPLTIDWFISGNFSYRIAGRSDSKGLVTATDIEQATDWESYPTYSDYVAIMQNFAANYPSLCKLETIGTSVNGKQVLALKISDNAATDENEPEVFYTSTIHGDELAGFVLMMRLADSLLTSYSTSQRLKNLIDNLEIWINPLANPDGTYGTGNVISSPSRYNANGKDLNRNFPDPLDLTIVPPKENIDMIKFMRKRKFVLSANFHSGAEVLNYPWDRWLSKYHADDSWFVQICRGYADTVHLYSGPAYLNDYNNGIVRGAVWYIIYGGRQDFVTWELQGREVTMEIDDIFETPAAQLGLLWIYNRRSLINYLENALYGIHGFVREDGSSNPVPAKIFISGHDKDSSHVYSDTLSGMFTRLLSPGSWNLSFTAKGYRDTTVNNITVTAGQKTDLTVFMKPVATTIDTADPEVPLLYPNPASESVNCRLPDRLSGNVKVLIFDNSGRKIEDFSVLYMPGSVINIDIRDLTAGTYTITFRNVQTGLSFYSRLVVTGRFFK